MVVRTNLVALGIRRPMEDKLTHLQQRELDALAGDVASVMQTVLGLRMYRRAVAKLLANSSDDSLLDLKTNIACIEAGGIALWISSQLDDA